MNITKTAHVPPIVREYNIRGTKYIVTAKTKTGARQDAATIIRRLIRKELERSRKKVG